MNPILYCYTILRVRRRQGVRQPKGPLQERPWERSREGAFQMEYLHVFSDLNSFANQLSSSNYVDPPSFRVQPTPDTHHPESVPRNVPKESSAGRAGGAGPSGRTHISRIHSCNRRLPITMYPGDMCPDGRPAERFLGTLPERWCRVCVGV